MKINLVLATTGTDGCNNRETADLSVTHAASSYGIPVLVIDGIAYGRNDAIPTRFIGEMGCDAVIAALNFGSGFPGGETDSEIERSVDRFLGASSRL